MARNSPRLVNLWPSDSRSNWNLEMLVFEERGKPEYPKKNLSEQGREPTTNSTHIQYCAKVMQTNFDEFPGFSGLFDENLLETNFQRYFAAFSQHLLFQPREFSSESSLRIVLRREFSCDNSLFPIIRSECMSEISSIVALKFSRKVCYE